MKIPASLLLFAISSHVAPLFAAPTYTITDLGTLPGDNGSEASGINSSGVVVGQSNKFVSGEIVGHAFLYANGTMVDLGTLGGASSNAKAINDSGVVVGWSQTSDGDRLPFKFADTMQLATSSGDVFNCGANAISGDYIAGGALNSNGFLIHGSDVRVFGGINGGSGSEALGVNSAGVTVGRANNSSNQRRAFIYSGEEATIGGDTYYPLTDLNSRIPSNSGWVLTRANAINSAGVIVGEGQLNGEDRGFVYSNGNATAVPGLSGVYDYSVLFAINSLGQAVGLSATSSDYDTGRAILYVDGVVHDLQDLIPADSGWLSLQSANAINNAGQIAGTGYNAQGVERAFLLTPVGGPTPTPTPAPAPPTAKLLGKSKVTTSKAKLPVKGKATGIISKVTYRVGNKGAFKKAKGTNSWSFTAKLKPGKNKITVLVSGPSGDAKPLKLVVTRKD